MPIRLKAVHIVKEPFVFNMVFQLFKPFIQEKLKSRVNFEFWIRKTVSVQTNLHKKSNFMTKTFEMLIFIMFENRACFTKK